MFNVISILVLASLNLCSGVYEDCDQDLYIGAYDTDTIYSPQFPFYYPVNSSCRYTIKAPSGYLVEATCLFYLEKTDSLCESEIFRVSSDDRSLNNAEIFCGLNYFKRHSLFNELFIGYTSSGKKGMYKCYIKSLPQACDCGWSINTKLTRTNEAGINQYPSTVAIVDINSDRIICTATIINYRFLLSAASCFYDKPDISIFRAYIGDHDISTNSETTYNEIYEILRIILHPNFDSSTFENDISIIETKIDITWKLGVGPACLPYNYFYNQFDNNTVNVAGWLQHETNLSRANSVSYLQSATVTVTTSTPCEDSNLCTLTDDEEACQFYSGSPLLYLKNRQYIVGITTNHEQCEVGNIIQNLRVSPYIWWIYNNTNVNYCIK